MIRLLCVGRYANSARNLVFLPGQTFEADPDLERFLMADAPGCFQVAPTVKAFDAPPKDKAIKRSDEVTK